MPKFRITAPDGKSYDVTAPDGASQEEVLAYAQAHYQSPEAAPKAWKPRGRTVQELHDLADAHALQHPATEGMSGAQQFAAGVGETLTDTYEGMKQLGVLATGGSMAPDRAPLYAKTVQDTDTRRQVGQALVGSPLAITGKLSGIAGQILVPGAAATRYASLAPEAAAAVRAASLPKTVGGAGVQGAALGFSQPVGSNDSRALNTGVGGLAGLAGAGIPRAVGGLVSLAKRPFEALSEAGIQRRVAEVLRSEAENPAALMRPQPSAIPGVQRTLAEESLDPGIARMERNARSTGRGFDTLDRTNNAARVSALETFAGDEASVAAAKSQRALASNQARKEAMQIDGVDTSRLLSQIKRLETMQTGRPAVQSGLAQVRELLTRAVPEAERKKMALAPLMQYASTGRKSAADFEAAKAAMTAIRRGELPEGDFSSKAGQDALKAARKAFGTESKGQDRVAVLDNVRKTIGDMLGGKYGGESAASLAGSRELMAIKGQLDRVLAKQAPQYGDYLNAYRAGSVPINRMEIGQELMGSRSGSAILDPVTGQQVLTPAAFSRGARNLDQVAAKATGFRKAKAGDYLRPEDQRIIAGVQDDLERRNFAATAGSGGNSQTFERGALADRMGVGLASRVPILGGAVDILNRMGQSRLQSKLAEVLANPQQARSILGSVPAHDRQIIVHAISRAGGTIANTGAVLAE